jgi:hypothetical protein
VIRSTLELGCLASIAYHDLLWRCKLPVRMYADAMGWCAIEWE